MERLETTDLFRAGSLLCLGARLGEVRRNKGQVTFCLQGDELTDRDQDYRLGRTRIEPLQFRQTLNLLRDMIFRGGHHGN